MHITLAQLQKILPGAGDSASVFVTALNQAMLRYEVQGPLRAAAFIAQVGHESAHLRHLVERFNYSAPALLATWPKRFTPQMATASVGQPSLIAQIAYGNRLGNVEPGDGFRYCGRGLIQITGKYNYQACSKALGVDCVAEPELLEIPDYAALSAAWFWSENGLNELADLQRFEQITRRLNGGVQGQEDRRRLYEAALCTFCR